MTRDPDHDEMLPLEEGLGAAGVPDLDEMFPLEEAPAPASSLMEAALDYAVRGLPVFPVWGVEDGRCRCGRACDSPGKHPLGALVSHGVKDATGDAKQIRRWWTRYPDANIGTPTSWTTVLDVDPRHGGDKTLAALVHAHGALPETPETRTGGGGQHFFFAPVPGLTPGANKVGPGLDIKTGPGAYVLLPPSGHVSGQRYTVSRALSETPLAAMPAWLIARAGGSAWLAGTNAPAAAPRSGDAGLDWAARLAGASEGERHVVACENAGHFLSYGLPAAEVEQILLGFAGRCTPPFPEGEARRIVRDLAAKDHARAEAAAAAWPEPEPLPHTLVPVPAFDASWLPESLRAWALDIAERTQCPLDYVAVAALIGAAAVVGRRIALRPKREDDWTVVPNLWGLVIGRPGSMKSPALAATLLPLRQLVAEAKDAHHTALADFKAQALESEIRRDGLKRELRDAIKNRASTETLQQDYAATEDESEPTERRYLVNDTTVEKLGELLNLNPNGLLVYRDELAGFLQTMEREGHQNDRAFYCEAWAGTGSYTYDRITRGTLHIEAACISMLGGIAPGPLQRYLRAAFAGEGGDDGLIQRFQLAVYPDLAAEWRNVDRWPDTEAKSRVSRLYHALDTLDAQGVGAEPATRFEDLPCLRFAPPAQAVFNRWRARLERRLRSRDEHTVIVSHLAKYRSLMPSLALLFHLIECVDGGLSGPVTLKAAEQAVVWCDYLEAHARRIYHAITDRAGIAVAALAAKLRAGKPKNPFTVRDIYHCQWAGLTDREDVLPALAQLTDLQWIRVERSAPTPQGGRPSNLYFINPKVISRP